MKGFTRAFQVMAFVAMTSIAAMAQTSGVTADLSGTVFDQTGAVLPGVMITITANATGLTRSVFSEEKGQFLAQNLPSGTYTVKAELSGFSTVTLNSVTVTLGQRVNVPIAWVLAPSRRR
jgi:Carboxypeptidase regulatory-like domain